MLFEESVLLDYVHNKPLFDEYDSAVSQHLGTTLYKITLRNARLPSTLITRSDNCKTLRECLC
jgi:hypothetical protein